VGGGERAPFALRRSFPLRGKIVDAVRDIANVWVKFDPLMHAVFRRASVILCKTPETMAAIPSRYRAKCHLQMEIGAFAAAAPSTASGCRRDGLRVLYAGRLVYLKGVHLALAAFARLRRTQSGARFTVVGNGPERTRWERLAEDLGVACAVDWRPWLPRAELMDEYLRHDVLLFPSLHDSSGNTVLEALANGVPVVCLNLGGPRVLVDDRCGIRVNATDERGAIDGLAAALATLSRDPRLRAQMSRAARARVCAEFYWPRQAEKMSRIYDIATTPPGFIRESTS